MAQMSVVKAGYLSCLLLLSWTVVVSLKTAQPQRTALNGCSMEEGSCSEKDRVSYESISSLHRLIDDDHDGDVDLSESKGFLRDELQYADERDRHNKFHGDDTKVSVTELWKTWKSSEVHNWTVEETVTWLVNYVELPQYAETFQTKVVDGSALPRIAVNPQFVSTVLGIKNPVHKQKLALKAMDVVLFGPPKRGHSYVKDLILVTSLVIAAGGCWFAYVQNQTSKTHLKKMMKDLDVLQKAEDSLMELQERLNNAQQEQKNVQEEKIALEKKMKDEIDDSKKEAQRLKEQRENVDEAEKRYKLAEEELEHVRALLSQAEQQLEDHQWIPPPELQQWLQLTYEIELKHYNAKKLAAEKQLTLAKEGCDKIRRKRNTFMGSLRIAHSSSIDSIDARIIEARTSLEEVRKDLQERLNRWRKIELLCGFPIINNPGMSVIESALKDSAAQSPTSPSNLTSQGSRRSSAAVLSSMDDTDDELGAPPLSSAPGAKNHGKFYALGLAAMYATSFRRRQQQQQGIRPRSQSLVPGALANSYSSHMGARISPGSPSYTVMPHPMSATGLSALYHSQPEITSSRRLGAIRGQSEIWNLQSHRASPPSVAQEIGTVPEVGDDKTVDQRGGDASSPDSGHVTFSVGASSPDEAISEPQYPTASATTLPKVKPSAVPERTSRPTTLPVSHSDPVMAFMGAQVPRQTPVTDRQCSLPDRTISASGRSNVSDDKKLKNGDCKSPESAVAEKTVNGSHADSNGDVRDRTLDRTNSSGNLRNSDEDVRSESGSQDVALTPQEKRKHRLNISVFSKKDKTKKV